MIEQDKKDVGYWWVWILFLVLVTLIALNSLGYVSKFMSVFVERKVFETSYQRSEGLRSQSLAWEAQLASINSQLLYEPNNRNLKTQKSMLEIQIAQTKGMK